MKYKLTNETKNIKGRIKGSEDMKFPKYNNFICKRCGRLCFYSPDYIKEHSLCEDCLRTANWFWKLVDKYL